MLRVNLILNVPTTTIIIKKLKDSKSRSTSNSFTQQIHRAATLPSRDQNRQKYQPPYSLHFTGETPQTNNTHQIALYATGKNKGENSNYGEFRDRQTTTVNTAGWSGKASLKGDLKQVKEEESPLGLGSSQAEVPVGAKALPRGGPGMYAEQSE